MVLLANKQAVLAVPAEPPRYGLLVAAPKLPADDVVWEGGIQWAPEQNNGGGVVAADCHGETATMTPGTNIPVSKADPFVVWAEDHCSTIGYLARDYEGRARRQLEATQSYRIANELWLGTEAQAVTLENEYLVRAPEILASGTAFSPIPALATIDQGLGQMLAGQRGMIHVSPNLLDQMDAGGGLTQSGQIWITAMGNIIVADAGYPGTKPAGAAGTNQWIYATPMIRYRLSEVFARSALDRSVNLMVAYAERMALLQWDTTIPVGNHSKAPVLAVETNIPAFAFTA